MLKTQVRTIVIFAHVFAFGMALNPGAATDYVFPAAARVFDVTKAPYNADNTGKTDVSAILSKAANDIINIPGWNPGIMYLPNGTYLVKNTITWKITANGNGVGPHMIGQSRHGTIIKLAKGTWPLGTEGKPVIQTGAGNENNFNKSIINLTVLVDSNNAGAIGVVYVADNTGMMSDVDIISADGKGQYGIQSAGNFTGSTVGGNGPFIIRRTRIKGFAVGFRGCATEGEMMSQIRLEGQSKYGLWVSCGDLIVDSLTTNDTCIAVEAEAPVLLTNAVLAGGSPTAYAVRNFVTSSFFRDIKTTGYKFAISSVGTNRPPLVSAFDEYAPVPTTSLFPAPKKSLDLPAKYPPEIPWETDFTKWAFPADYKTGGRTDAQALQAAIDDPAKTTVCLPHNGVLQLDGPVYVRGNISRIISTGGGVHKASASARIVIDDGSAPAVMIQKLSVDNIGVADCDLPSFKQTGRIAVIESTVGLCWSITGSGETYLTDLGSTTVIDNPQAKAYLWQWESRPEIDSTLIVRNGMARVVGTYDEGSGSMIYCMGGITEILGFWEYATGCDHNGHYLIGIRNNANVSAAGVWQQNFCNPWGGYDQLVSETRNGATNILYGSAGTGRTVSPAGSNIALFTAYDSAQAALALQSSTFSSPSQPWQRPRCMIYRKPARSEIAVCGAPDGPLSIVACDLRGRVAASADLRLAPAAIHRLALPNIAGVACISVRFPGGDETVRFLLQNGLLVRGAPAK